MTHDLNCRTSVIGYYVHHQGLGHLHRALTLTAALRARGHEVTVLSSLPAPEAYDGPHDSWVRLADDADGPAPLLDPSPSGALHWVPAHHDGLRERTATISAWIASATPRLMISDVSQEVTVLARLHGVPVLSVVLPGRRDDDPHALGFALSARLVGFWPPAADRMLLGVPAPAMDRFAGVGALARFAGDRPADPHLLSDDASDDLSDHRPLAVVLAGAGGAAWTEAELDAFEAGAPGWRFLRLGGAAGWVQDPWPALCAADVVVTHAGQNALAEVAAARVPAVVVPAPRPFDEQVTTARQLDAGPWPCVTRDRLEPDRAQVLLNEVRALDGAGWSTWCDGGAAGRFVDVVEGVLRATAPAPAPEVVAVITLVRDRHAHLALQQESLRRQDRPADLRVVVSLGDPDVVVAAGDHLVHLDVAPGEPLPLAAGRNAGAARALALGASVLVFLDVDCLAGPGTVGAYADAVRDHPDTVWSGPVTYLAASERPYPVHDLASLDRPHPARPAPVAGERCHDDRWELFWSLSFAVAAAAWERCGGFDEDYTGYGAEDTDFGQRARRAGLRPGWTGDARAYHQHHPTRTPPVQHLHDILRNGRTFAGRWGWWPMTGWLAAFEEQGLVRRAGDDWVLQEAR